MSDYAKRANAKLLSLRLSELHLEKIDKIGKHMKAKDLRPAIKVNYVYGRRDKPVSIPEVVKYLIEAFEIPEDKNESSRA